MPQVEVNCTVVNCIFHAKGDLCGAERIQVDMDERISKKAIWSLRAILICMLTQKRLAIPLKRAVIHLDLRMYRSKETSPK